MFSVFCRSSRGIVRVLQSGSPRCARNYSDASSEDTPKGQRRKPEEMLWKLESEDDLTLPPLDKWRKYFPNDSSHTRDRASVRTPEAADAVARAFVPSGSRYKVIIEAYPGPGQLTRALLRLPRNRISKIIVLEDHDRFLHHLRPLEKADDRVTVLPIPGYYWDSYQKINQLGLLDDVKVMEWDAGVHPQLQFITHLPMSVLGEQLAAQLCRSIPDRTWLFKYGRVPLSMLLSDSMWKRLHADVNSSSRCKVSVIAEAVADCKLALPTKAISPHNSHFHPSYLTAAADRPNKLHSQFQAVTVTPREEQVIAPGLLDKWDYCLRRLYVLKSQPLKQAISSLAPGAKILLNKIDHPDIPPEDRVDIKTQVRKMTVRDWAIFLKAFDEWPFAPEDLSIADFNSGRHETKR